MQIFKRLTMIQEFTISYGMTDTLCHAMLQTEMNVTRATHFSKTYHQQELLYMLPLFVRSELTQWFCCIFKAHDMSHCAVGIIVPDISRTAMSSSAGSNSPRWETAMLKGLGTSQMWRKWCGQKDLYNRARSPCTVILLGLLDCEKRALLKLYRILQLFYVL